MRGTTKKAAAALACCALALGLAACSSGANASDPSKGGNELLVYTSANVAEPQELKTVTFGTYPQAGNDAEPIAWLVLDEQDGRTLLISEYVLDAQPFNDVDAGYAWSVNSPRLVTSADWADSSLRAWLNGQFAKEAFTADEQSAIAEVTLEDAKSNIAHTSASAADPSIHQTGATTDKVFLLSVAEAKQYFDSNDARLAMPTDYAVAQGVYTGQASNDQQADGASIWWLRTPGYYAGYTAVVVDDGYVHGAGYRNNGEVHDGFDDHGTVASELGGNMGVRPCIWVDTAALS